MQNGDRALVCEDDDMIRALLDLILRRRGFSVGAVSNGRAAIEALSLCSYDLVVLDLLMPDVSGYQVLEYLRSTRPEILPRVVVMTAFQEALHEHLPVAAVVQKPFDINELNSVIDRVMYGRRVDAPLQEWIAGRSP